MTTTEILVLKADAKRDGDLDLVDLCDRAVGGDESAIEALEQMELEGKYGDDAGSYA